MRVHITALALVVAACSQQAEPLDESEKTAAPQAEAPEQTPETKPEPAEVKAKALDPVETCEALVLAAKTSDPEAFGSVATDAAIEAMAKNEKLTEGVLQALSSSTCGEATVAGESATVSVAAGETTRDIPFTQVGGVWRFDGAAYLEKYPMPEEEKAAKKSKKKRKKKRRRKG
ncbi:MAG: hypothetical protein AAFQ82_18135 [Myxococcota bacterium]